jgi:hypothetical protein
LAVVLVGLAVQEVLAALAVEAAHRELALQARALMVVTPTAAAAVLAVLEVE